MAPCDTKAIETLQSISKKYASIKFDNLDSLHADGSVFLKGNQKTGNVFIRSENGLGEGILVTCQYDKNPAESNTFGPLPLDFFIINFYFCFNLELNLIVVFYQIIRLSNWSWKYFLF